MLAKNVPTPPDYLQPATRDWFKSVVADFELDQHHVRLLTLACEAWDRGQQARLLIAEEGITVAGERARSLTRQLQSRETCASPSLV